MSTYNRRRFLTKSTLALGATLLPWQRIFAASGLVGDNIFKLRGNVYRAMGPGGTMGIFMDKDAMVVVDTQVQKPALAMVNKIKDLTDRKIDYVINTHHHWDHINGNPLFREISNELVAHEKCAEYQARRGEEHWHPTIQYKDTWSQRVGSEIVSLHHLGHQAHTAGDSIVHFENANVVHAGDLIWNLAGPFIDHGGGCNMMAWIDALDAMDRKFDSDTMYVFGHGRTIAGSNELLKDFRNYLENTIKLVDQRHRAGDSLKQILEIKTVPGSEKWPYSERTLRGAYAEVTGRVKRVTYAPLDEACCADEHYHV